MDSENDTNIRDVLEKLKAIAKDQDVRRQEPLKVKKGQVLASDGTVVTLGE